MSPYLISYPPIKVITQHIDFIIIKMFHLPSAIFISYYGQADIRRRRLSSFRHSKVKRRSETAAASSPSTMKGNLHFDSDYVNLLAKATWLLDSP
ncbi:hypothetical protein EAO00_12620 [Klebsiella pneumoniae]|nr:hypothetical protein EAO00_12620 [Klebsiella pneumoniae]